MIALIETRRLGRCDELPDGSYVVTDFYSTGYVPLLPRQSYFVAAGGRAIAIGLSMKSLAAAYLRAAVAIFGIALLVGGLLLLARPFGPPNPETTITAAVTVAVGLVAIVASFAVRVAFARPSPERRRDLERLAQTYFSA